MFRLFPSVPPYKPVEALLLPLALFLSISLPAGSQEDQITLSWKQPEKGHTVSVTRNLKLEYEYRKMQDDKPVFTFERKRSMHLPKKTTILKKENNRIRQIKIEYGAIEMTGHDITTEKGSSPTKRTYSGGPLIANKAYLVRLNPLGRFQSATRPSSGKKIKSSRETRYMRTYLPRVNEPRKQPIRLKQLQGETVQKGETIQLSKRSKLYPLKDNAMIHTLSITLKDVMQKEGFKCGVFELELASRSLESPRDDGAIVHTEQTGKLVIGINNLWPVLYRTEGKIQVDGTKKKKISKEQRIKYTFEGSGKISTKWKFDYN